jgi:hypothetical protein
MKPIGFPLLSLFMIIGANLLGEPENGYAVRGLRIGAVVHAQWSGAAKLAPPCPRSHVSVALQHSG